MARGIGIKVVADKAHNAKGYGFEAVMVRTDLFDSGKIKSVKDFKGLKVAISANGNSEDALMNYTLVQNGLSYKDIDPVFLGFPNQIAAYANKGIDASLTVEPTVTRLEQLGTAKKLISADDIFPDFQTAVIFYSPKFTHDQPENAKKFMVALVKAMRLYNDALAGRSYRRSECPMRSSTSWSNIRSSRIRRCTVPSFRKPVNPNGDINRPSLQMAWQYFKDTKQIDGSVEARRCDRSQLRP